MRAQHDALVAQCGNCTKCRLRLNRRNVVVYRGSLTAPLMLVGEAPGAEEDLRGIPFIGPSGRLLDRLLERAGVPPEGVYICNTVKCRPLDNRDPTPEETAACRPFFVEQLALVKPRRIVTLGRVATAAVTATRGPMGALLSQGDLTCFWGDESIPVIPVYHPSYLLRRLDDESVRVELQDTVARLRRAWHEACGQAAHPD